jgi:hypothetical protein
MTKRLILVTTLKMLLLLGGCAGSPVWWHARMQWRPTTPEEWREYRIAAQEYSDYCKKRLEEEGGEAAVKEAVDAHRYSRYVQTCEPLHVNGFNVKDLDARLRETFVQVHAQDLDESTKRLILQRIIEPDADVEKVKQQANDVLAAQKARKDTIDADKARERRMRTYEDVKRTLATTQGPQYEGHYFTVDYPAPACRQEAALWEQVEFGQAAKEGCRMIPRGTVLESNGGVDPKNPRRSVIILAEECRPTKGILPQGCFFWTYLKDLKKLGPEHLNMVLTAMGWK